MRRSVLLLNANRFQIELTVCGSGVSPRSAGAAQHLAGQASACGRAQEASSPRREDPVGAFKPQCHSIARDQGTQAMRGGVFGGPAGRTSGWPTMAAAIILKPGGRRSSSWASGWSAASWRNPM
jgi:hypothetical protein